MPGPIPLRASPHPTVSAPSRPRTDDPESQEKEFLGEGLQSMCTHKHLYDWGVQHTAGGLRGSRRQRHETCAEPVGMLNAMTCSMVLTLHSYPL